MGMDGGGGTGRAVSGINVTPLIDVLLVLLIIFMLLVPVAPDGLSTLIPQPPKNKDEPPPEAIVVSIQANGNGQPSYLINQDVFTKSQIEPKLAAIFAARHEKVMFVKGDAALEYSKVVEVIDMGHQANVTSIGLITPRIAASQ